MPGRGPLVTCEFVRTRLFMFLDGELSAAERGPLSEHVGLCPECRHVLELEQAYREIYVAPLRPDPIPPLLRQRAARLLAGQPGPSGPRWRQVCGSRRAALAGLAACALLLAGVGVVAITRPPRAAAAALDRLAAAGVEQHRRLAGGLLPLDIEPATHKDAEEWFSARLDFPVRLPELRYEHLTLAGGRILNLQAFQVAALEYRVDGKDVSLFVMPPEQYRQLGLKPEPKFKMISRNGYDVIVWNSPRHAAAYALVSEIGPGACMICHAAADRDKLNANVTPEAHRPQ
jgi:anti-sigma factor RsiW